MATRFLLPESGAAPITNVNPMSTWEGTVDFDRRPCGTAATNTGTAYKSASNYTNTANQEAAHRLYITEGLAAGTIAAGTVHWQVLGRNDDGDLNFAPAMGVKAVSGDGTTIRGTLLAVTQGTTQFAASSTPRNRRIRVAHGSVVLQSGDRLVFELGSGGNPEEQNRNCFLQFGDPTALSDLPDGEGTSGDPGTGRPWVEMSANLTFVGQAGNAPRQFYRHAILGDS